MNHYYQYGETGEMVHPHQIGKDELGRPVFAPDPVCDPAFLCVADEKGNWIALGTTEDYIRLAAGREDNPVTCPEDDPEK